MSTRSELARAFLLDAGWGNAEITPLAGDASFRRYDRVALNGREAVLMDAPPDKEDVRPFLTICRHLRSLSYSAPEVFAEDLENGFILLEDLGDTTFTHRLSGGTDERVMYEGAVDLLIDLHCRPANSTVPPGLPLYDTDRYLEEAFLLTDWYMPQVAVKSDQAKQAYEAAWRSLLAGVQREPNTLVLRDFHADNLMWLPERESVAACGLLDFQDALAGHPAYDLMSLLEDARRDLSPGLAEAMIDRYCAAFPEMDRKAFQKTYTILAAQRHCKVIGIFTRLAIRDGKTDYLCHLPRVWRLLERACATSWLAPLQDWLDIWLPPPMRSLETAAGLK